MTRGTFVDQINETPVTYAVLLIYVTMAFLTDPFDPTSAQLVDYGACVGLLVQDGEMWRLLSCAFLHGGILHLLLNSYGLMILGPFLERTLGIWRFCVLYVVAAVAGSLFADFVNPEYIPLVGGSGALFGMMGAALAHGIRGGRTLLDFLSSHGARMLITLIALNLLAGLFIHQVSNAAHIGGLLAGFVLVFCFFQSGRRVPADATGRAIQAGWILVLASLLFYSKAPVLRFDYMLKEYLYAPEGQRRQALREILEQYSVWIPHPEANVQGEQEPKTGLAAVAFRERHRYVPALNRAVLRWKRETQR